jgi:hypothetical protein
MRIKKTDLEKILVEETIREITSAMGGDDLDFGGPASRERFTGGSIDIDPLSDEEQDSSTDAYYELRDFLMDGPGAALPGSKPSDKLRHALRWIAKFEQGSATGGPDAQDNALRQFTRNAPGVKRSVDGSRSLEEGVVDMDGETVITGPDGDASPLAQSGARQDDLKASMMKAVLEIKGNRPQEAYETLLRALAAAGVEGADDLPGTDLEEYRSTGTGSSNKDYRGGSEAGQSKKRKDNYRSGATGKKNQGRGGY